MRSNALDDDVDAVDALFAEAFALLEAASPTAAPVSPARAAAGRGAGPAKRGGEGSTARRKRMIDDLRVEETALREQLRRLSGCTPHHEATHDDWARAVDERVKRWRAEKERQALRDALYQHTLVLRSMGGFLGGAFKLPVSLNLYHHLHDFTRLPCDVAIRQHEYAVLRREQRFLAAVDLLCRETDRLPVVDSHIEAECLQPSASVPCAITTKSVYVMDDCDVPTALRAACVAVRDIIVKCRAYSWVGTAGEIVDADTLSQSNLQYRLTSIRRMSALDSEDFSVEARTLVMYKMLGDAAVVLWDFVDEDELYPLDETPDISRQGVGACLIRREMCPDGVERTVYREFSTRRYLYKRSTPPSPSVLRYLTSKRQAMREHEQQFRDLMLEQIAIEKASAVGLVAAQTFSV